MDPQVANSPAAEPGWTAWTPAERESFFDAIERHRRAAWRVTLASAAGNILVALIVAILMSPLFYGALALLCDVLNLIVPVPNLVPHLADALDKPFNAPGSLTVVGWLKLGILAALPGLIWMAFVLRALRRVLRLCMTLEAGEFAPRAPDASVLAEQRFSNVVAEMALAANLPPPRVLVAESDVADAVAFGVDERQATLLISRGLLSRLNRAQMEGIAGDLTASIANGDMRIGVQAALSVSLFALVARLSTLITGTRNARRRLLEVARVMLIPTAASARAFVEELTDPFAHNTKNSDPAASPPPSRTPTPPAGPNILDLRARWAKIRPYLWLPLLGPLVLTGFFGGIVNLFILGPLLSLAWRQRKYMADATAVRLTRDPDTLASALEILAGAGSKPLAAWGAHMSVVSQGIARRGIIGGSAVPMFPSIDSRLRALGKMGAHVSRPPRHIPLRLLLIIVPLCTILAVLVAIMLPLLIWLSMASTALFAGVPFGIVHMLLRWLGHH